jgi:hypothetical protein
VPLEALACPAGQRHPNCPRADANGHGMDSLGVQNASARWRCPYPTAALDQLISICAGSRRFLSASFFFSRNTVYRRRSHTRTYIHHYERTHTYPTYMSTSKRMQAYTYVFRYICIWLKPSLVFLNRGNGKQTLHHAVHAGILGPCLCMQNSFATWRTMVNDSSMSHKFLQG